MPVGTALPFSDGHQGTSEPKALLPSFSYHSIPHLMEQKPQTVFTSQLRNSLHHLLPCQMVQVINCGLGNELFMPKSKERNFATVSCQGRFGGIYSTPTNCVMVQIKHQKIFFVSRKNGKRCCGCFQLPFNVVRKGYILSVANTADADKVGGLKNNLMGDSCNW